MKSILDAFIRVHKAAEDTATQGGFTLLDLCQRATTAVLNKMKMKSGEEGELPRNMDWVLAQLHSGIDDAATFVESLVRESSLRRGLYKLGIVAEQPPPQFQQLEVTLRGVMAVLKSLNALPDLPTMGAASPLPEERQDSPELPLPWDAFEVAQSLYDFAAQLEMGTREGKIPGKVPLQEHRHNYQAGEALCRQAVKIWEHFLWHSHPQLAKAYATLGALTEHQGKVEEADRLYLRAIEIGEKTLGPDHPDYPDLATWLNKRAELLQGQGKYAEAEAFYERSQAIQEKVLGPDHPNVVESLKSRAGLLKSQGKYAEAETFFMRLQTIQEELLGPDHPDVAESLKNRAGLLKSQGKYDEAQPLLERSLAIREKALGLDHPDVTPLLSSLAEVLTNQGKLTEAGPLYIRTGEILDNLVEENRETMVEIRRLVGQDAADDTLISGTELTSKLEELDRLVALAKTFEEMASRHAMDLDLRTKEMSLDPGRRAYSLAVRSGLGNAYIAASVVSSDLISTSEVGNMGKAGAALKLLSGSSPSVGGLAGPAGAALKAGDSYIRTRSLRKIADLAPDAVQCFMLARMLAVRLTDGLTDDTIDITIDVNERLTRHEAGVGWGAGGSTSFALPEDMDEETALEWFIEQGIIDEPSNYEATTPALEVQAGRQLGKRHLRKLLTAVGRGCLQGTTSVEEKVNQLVLVVLPDVDISSAETPNAPVSEPSHDGRHEQLTAEQEALKTVKSDKEKHHTEVEPSKGKGKEPAAGGDDSNITIITKNDFRAGKSYALLSSDGRRVLQATDDQSQRFPVDPALAKLSRMIRAPLPRFRGTSLKFTAMTPEQLQFQDSKFIFSSSPAYRLHSVKHDGRMLFFLGRTKPREWVVWQDHVPPNGSWEVVEMIWDGAKVKLRGHHGQYVKWNGVNFVGTDDVTDATEFILREV
eukprot:g9314.t1